MLPGKLYSVTAIWAGEQRTRAFSATSAEHACQLMRQAIRQRNVSFTTPPSPDLVVIRAMAAETPPEAPVEGMTMDDAAPPAVIATEEEEIKEAMAKNLGENPVIMDEIADRLEGDEIVDGPEPGDIDEETDDEAPPSDLCFEETG